MDKEYEVLLSDKNVKTSLRTVKVSKLSFLYTIKLASKIGELVSKALKNEENMTYTLSKLAYISDNNKETASVRMAGVIELISSLSDGLLGLLPEIIVESTDLNEEECAKMNNDDGIEIIEAIYECNKSFFMKCLQKLNMVIPKKKKKEKEKTK